MQLQDILHALKSENVKCFLKLYVLYCFDEVLTSIKPNIMTFSITGI